MVHKSRFLCFYGILKGLIPEVDFNTAIARERANIVIKTYMYKSFQKVRVQQAPCQQNDPNRNGLGVAH